MLFRYLVPSYDMFQAAEKRLHTLGPYNCLNIDFIMLTVHHV